MFSRLDAKTVDGVTYGVLTFNPVNRACLPINLSVGFETLVGSVRDNVNAPNAHPNQETSPFEILLPVALSQTYPCPFSLGQ
jgi:hypothetical protein